jgi:hypothetical protein
MIYKIREKLPNILQDVKWKVRRQTRMAAEIKEGGPDYEWDS